MDWTYAIGRLFREFRTNRLRRFLSMLGVIIGTAAVISSLAVVEGGRDQLHAYLSKLGVNLVVVEDKYEAMKPTVVSRATPAPASGEAKPNAGPTGGKKGQMEPTRSTMMPRNEYVQLTREVETISYDDISFLRSRFPRAIYVAPQLVMRTDVGLVGERSFRASVEGSTPDGAVIRNLHTGSGRRITQADLDNREKVCVLGAGICMRIFGRVDAVGQEISAFGSRWTVVGVLERKGSLMRFDYDQLITVPITSLHERAGTDLINAVLISARDVDSALKIRGEITDEILARLRDRKVEDFQVFCQDELIQQKEQTLRTFRILTFCIAAFSLLVSGIGIMNIMLVSVRERTREIGIWKAVGATDEDVLSYFLAESVLTCFVGGLLGILLGIYLGSEAARMIGSSVVEIAGWQPVFKPEFFILSVGVSILVGLLSGIFPAYVAARLEPMEALRYG